MTFHNNHAKCIIFTFMGLIIFLQGTFLFAVSETAVLFLLISPSPQANGMGHTYAAAASKDPMASLMNPAYLGCYTEHYNAGLSFSYADWLPELVSDMSYHCVSANAGLTLKKMPVSFGLGLHRIFLDMGENVWTSESGTELDRFESCDKAHVLSLAGSWNYLINFSAGMNIKWIHSMLAPDWISVGSKQGAGEAKSTAYDFGMALKIPAVQSFEHIYGDPIFGDFPVSIFLTPGVNYSINNIGEKLTYMDPKEADPLPRAARTGIHFETGLRYQHNDFRFNIVSFCYAREAMDILAEKQWDANHEKTSIRYQSGLGDIDFFHNILQGKKNYHAETMDGWEFSLCETADLRYGYYEDISGNVNYHTLGVSLNILPAFKLYRYLFGHLDHDDLIDFFITYGDIEILYSQYDTDKGHPLQGTYFVGFRLQLRNFISL
ncbi:hypothetical protein JW835_02620 [bacterium]|nr:hypothetical protein [bacterium]